MKTKEKKIVKTQEWIVRIITYSDGTQGMARTNDGFTAFELLGIITHAKGEILQQMDGVIAPKNIQRNVIKVKNNA